MKINPSEGTVKKTISTEQATNEISNIYSQAYESAKKESVQNMQRFFKYFAGADGEMDGTEFDAFMKKLLDYAKQDGDVNDLSEAEIIAFMKDNHFSVIDQFRIVNFQQMIANVLKQNNANLEEEAKIPDNQKYPTTRVEDKNGDLKKEIITYPDGSKKDVIYSSKGTVAREILKDASGEIIENVTFNKNGTKTYHMKSKFHKEDFKTLDKDGNLVSDGYIHRDGYKLETFYDSSSNIKKVVKSDNDYIREDQYQDGHVVKRINRNKGKVVSSSTYTYNKENGSLIYENKFDEKGNKVSATKYVPYKNAENGQYLTDYMDGHREIVILHNYSDVSREVYDANNKLIFRWEIVNGGTSKSTDYNPDGSFDELFKDEDLVTKIIRRNADGTINETQEFKYDADGIEVEETLYDANDKLRYRREKLDDGTSKITHYNPDGSFDEWFADKDGRRTTKIERNSNGDIIQTTKYEYDGYLLSREVVYDANDNVLHSSETSIQGNVLVETNKDSNGNVISVDEHEFHDTEIVYHAHKNAEGELIYSSTYDENHGTLMIENCNNNSTQLYYSTKNKSNEKHTF